jgi:hypothetical protein
MPGAVSVGLSDSVMDEVICSLQSVWHENPRLLSATDPDPCPGKVISRITNPVPVNWAVAGWPAADATVRVPELLPNAVGANCTVTLQD